MESIHKKNAGTTDLGRARGEPGFGGWILIPELRGRLISIAIGGRSTDARRRQG